MKSQARPVFRTRPAFCLLGLRALCVLGLVSLAACAGPQNDGGPQSFNAHLNGSYSFAAVATSVR